MVWTNACATLPPRDFPRSNRSVCEPSSAAETAAATPADPPPTTITSKFSSGHISSAPKIALELIAEDLEFAHRKNSALIDMGRTETAAPQADRHTTARRRRNRRYVKTIADHRTEKVVDARAEITREREEERAELAATISSRHL